MIKIWNLKFWSKKEISYICIKKEKSSCNAWFIVSGKQCCWVNFTGAGILIKHLTPLSLNLHITYKTRFFLIISYCLPVCLLVFLLFFKLLSIWLMILGIFRYMHCSPKQWNAFVGDACWYGFSYHCIYTYHRKGWRNCLLKRWPLF